MDYKKTKTHYQFFKNFERIINFSDGVFSIALTLMVISLAVPVIATGDVSTELPRSLIGEWPTFFIYIISFFIIGNWWIIHHQLFQHIRMADRALLWLNLVFLFFITIIPFQTTLMIKYPGTFVAVVFFAATQAIAGIVLVILWYYATRERRLSDPDIPEVTIRYFSIRGILESVTFLISIGIAVFNSYLALLSWLFIGILVWFLDRVFHQKILPNLDQDE